MHEPCHGPRWRPRHGPVPLVVVGPCRAVGRANGPCAAWRTVPIGLCLHSRTGRHGRTTPLSQQQPRQPAVLAFVIRVQKRFRFRRTQHSIPIHAVLLCRPSVQVPASKTLPSPVVPAAEKPNPPTLLASPPTDQTRRLARSLATDPSPSAGLT